MLDQGTTIFFYFSLSCCRNNVLVKIENRQVQPLFSEEIENCRSHPLFFYFVVIFFWYLLLNLSLGRFPFYGYCKPNVELLIGIPRRINLQFFFGRIPYNTKVYWTVLIFYLSLKIKRRDFRWIRIKLSLFSCKNGALHNFNAHFQMHSTSM